MERRREGEEMKRGRWGKGYEKWRDKERERH